MVLIVHAARVSEPLQIQSRARPVVGARYRMSRFIKPVETNKTVLPAGQ
jgi:hypothetical protein